MKRTVNLLLILLGLVIPVHAGNLDEIRFCGPPARDGDGRIIRSATVLRVYGGRAIS